MSDLEGLVWDIFMSGERNQPDLVTLLEIVEKLHQPLPWPEEPLKRGRRVSFIGEVPRDRFVLSRGRGSGDETIRATIVEEADSQSDLPGVFAPARSNRLTRRQPEPVSPEFHSLEACAPDSIIEKLVDVAIEDDKHQLREFILLAEDTHFTVEQSAQLVPRLLEIALRYRVSNDPQDKPMVWSAIRTGASMLRPEDAKRLLPFLEPGYPIETSLVALKMIGRIFEAQPPTELDAMPDLQEYIKEIGDSFLNKFAISLPQSAAMAHLAIYALAAMGSNRVCELTSKVKQLNVDWFKRRTIRKLQELRSHWETHSSHVISLHRKLVDSALTDLES